MKILGLHLIVALALGGCWSSAGSSGDDSDAGGPDTNTSTGADADADTDTECANEERVIQGEFRVESAEQVDDYRCVRVVEGDLRIHIDGLVRLSGFPRLERITGLFSIGSMDALEEFDNAFPSLTRVHQLSISDNPWLKSLRGLSSLEEVERRAIFFDNSALESLAGLERLERVGETLGIHGNPQVQSLAPLESLVEAWTISVSSMDGLRDLSGLEPLVWTEGVRIEDNPALVSLSGLELSEIGYQGLSITGNQSLESLEGLEFLRTLRGDLRVEKNPSLRTLTGLENLAEILDGPPNVSGPTSALLIANNPSLESLNGIGALRHVEDQILICRNKRLASISEMTALIDTPHLSAIFNAALDSETARAFAETISSVEWIKIIANSEPYAPLGSDEECPWEGDGVCDAPLRFYGDYGIECPESCCMLSGPTGLCSEATGGKDCPEAFLPF